MESPESYNRLMLKALFLDRKNQPPSALGVIKVLPVAYWSLKTEKNTLVKAEGKCTLGDP